MTQVYAGIVKYTRLYKGESLINAGTRISNFTIIKLWFLMTFDNRNDAYVKNTNVFR